MTSPVPPSASSMRVDVQGALGVGLDGADLGHPLRRHRPAQRRHARLLRHLLRRLLPPHFGRQRLGALVAALRFRVRRRRRARPALPPASATPRDAPNPRATTTTLPRSRTAGTARTAAAAPRARCAAPPAPRPGPRPPWRRRPWRRRSGAPSPARRSCRRSPRRTLRCAAAPWRSRSRRARRVTSATSAARLVSMPRSSGAVTRCPGARVERQIAGEDELRGVEQLDGEPAPDLHLRRIEGRVDARPAARGPVAHRVRAVLVEQARPASRRCPSTSTSSCDRGRAPSPRSRCAPTAAIRARARRAARSRTARCG